MVGAIYQWAANLGDAVSANVPLFALFIFAIATIEFVLIAGFFIPSAALLFLTGTFIASGKLPFWPLLGAASGGAIVGETISYVAGRMLSGRLSGLWPFKDRPGYLLKAQALFTRYGSAAVFVGRFIPWVDCVTPAVAGALGMRVRTFAVLNLISAIGWAAIHILPAMMVGAGFMAMGLSPELTVVAGAVLLVALYGAVRLLRRRRRDAEN